MTSYESGTPADRLEAGRPDRAPRQVAHVAELAVVLARGVLAPSGHVQPAAGARRPNPALVSMTWYWVLERRWVRGTGVNGVVSRRLIGATAAASALRRRLVGPTAPRVEPGAVWLSAVTGLDDRRVAGDPLLEQQVDGPHHRLGAGSDGS